MAISEQDLETRIVELLRKITRVRESPIDARTELFRDLGIDGADAAELLDAYARQFHVDMTSFDFSSAFGPEAGPSLISLFRTIFGKKARRTAVSIGDLVAAARTGVWPRSGSNL